MFIISIIKDQLKTLPKDFNRNSTADLIEQIEIKYCNHILQDVGLGICFYDFITIGDAYLYPGEGSCHRQCEFRMVFFRPFIGEVLEGTIKSCNN